MERERTDRERGPSQSRTLKSEAGGESRVLKRKGGRGRRLTSLCWDGEGLNVNVDCCGLIWKPYIYE